MRLKRQCVAVKNGNILYMYVDRYVSVKNGYILYNIYIFRYVYIQIDR